jgi:hypothetical protein
VGENHGISAESLCLGRSEKDSRFKYAIGAKSNLTELLARKKAMILLGMDWHSSANRALL